MPAGVASSLLSQISLYHMQLGQKVAHSLDKKLMLATITLLLALLAPLQTIKCRDFLAQLRAIAIMWQNGETYLQHIL